MVISIQAIVHPIAARLVNELASFLKGEACRILGVKRKLERLQRRLERIRGVLEDAGRKGSQDAAISKWLKELKDVMYDADDILDLCMTKGKALEDQQSTSSVRISLTNLKFRRQIARKIEKLDDRLKEIIEDSAISRLVPTNPVVQMSGVNPRQTSAVMVESDIVGTAIEDSTRSLVESIIHEESQNCCLFGIVGMGGIGKTTLARKVYNDESIARRFSARIWVCVTKNFNETELLKEIIRGAGFSYGEVKSKAELEPILASVLPREFLLVLDDVWTADVWNKLLRNPLDSRATRGRILITTRDETVANGMRASVNHVEEMNDDDGWTLFCKEVFGDRKDDDMPNLEDIGKQIVSKCRGLPLAIKVIAGSLRSKDVRVWEKLLQSHAWSMARLPEELRGALYLSYEDLSPDLKQCFLFCTLYPEGRTMYYKDLIRFWMAEGFVRTEGETLMEERGEDYYKELIRRSLLQPDPLYLDNSRCTMHDLLHSLGRFLTQNENTLEDARGLETNPLVKIRRLSVMNMTTEMAVFPDAIMKKKCLRTLMFFQCPEAKTFECIFIRFKCLRVLNLCDTGIESLPDSVENLIHLRLLDLDRTPIRKLPESLASLRNLQTLNITGCKSLHELPKSITRLCNLRCLRFLYTPLSHVPRGIGRLQHLIHLEGFVVGNDGSTNDRQGGCSLGDLQSLPQLTYLWIDKLERAQGGGVLALANNSFLKELRLTCTPPDSNQPTYTEESMKRIEEIYQELCPPQSLQQLVIVGYFGRKFPSWMLSPTLGPSFPCLTLVVLADCRSCPQLPPLGQLPQLKYLGVEGANAIINIGPEFLGDSALSTIAFPKLEVLRMTKMPNWKEWSLHAVEEVHEERTSAPKILPRLKQLELIDCPKLRVLPQGLRLANNLQTLIIRGAHLLGCVENLPSVQENVLSDNLSMQSVSNLPTARRLVIADCPRLKHVVGLVVLRRLSLVCSPTRRLNGSNSGLLGEIETIADSLPLWVSELVEQRRHAQARTSSAPDDLEFILRCPKDMFLGCLRGCLDWRTIQQMCRVDTASNDGSGVWLEYTNTPSSYATNVSPEIQQALLTGTLPHGYRTS